MLQCEKTTYHSKHKAREQVAWIGRKGKKMRAYECERCHGWHITSNVDVKRSVKGEPL